MPAGAPTLYKPEYCQLLIDHMSKGYSFQSFAGLVSVATDTIYEWADKHPEFSEAHKVGVARSRKFWEEKGLEGIFSTSETRRKGNATYTVSKSMNAAVWTASMRTRFKDWNDCLFKSKEDQEKEKNNSGSSPKLVIEFTEKNGK